jgi:hypothetical protein
MPTAALSNQSHGDQFAITTLWLRPWTFTERGNAFPDIIHDNKHPGAKIFKVGYHPFILRCGELSLATHSYHIEGFFVNQAELA